MSEIVYTPGTWRAVVSPHGVAVLPPSVGGAPLDGALLGRIWTALDDGAGLGAVLESLAGSFGASLSALPPFAVATFDGGAGVRVAVRGAVSISIDEGVAGAGAGAVPQPAPVVVSGAEVTTWSERVVPAAAGLVIRTPSGDDAAGAGAGDRFGIASGVVLASTLEVVLTGSSRPSSAPETHVVSTPTQLTQDVSTPAEVTQLVSTEPAAAPEPTPESTQEESSEPEKTQAEELESTQAELPDDAYDHLWGATVVKSVEDAAVRELDDDEEEADAAPTPAPAAPDAAPALAPPAPEPAPVAPLRPAAPAPAVQSTGLIDSVPGFGTMGAASGSPGLVGTTVPPVRSAAAPAVPSAPAPTPPAPTPPASAPASAPAAPASATAPVGDDHDGLTVTVSELEAMRRLADAAPAAELPASALGRIVLSTGESYALDRPVIIGRRPRANRVQADAVPLLVAVASPEQDISRNHLEIRLEGRHVLAVDLATTNGSVLHREGSTPKRLGPNEPELVLSGDVIDLGDGVNVAFEEIP